jgi:hypothetical protein
LRRNHFPGSAAPTKIAPKLIPVNLILIPMIVSVVALGLLVVAVGVGSLLTLGQFRRHGEAIRRRGSYAATAALVFAWAGLMFAAVVGGLAGDRVAVAVLWGSGPLGFLVGLVWSPGARREDAPPFQARGEPNAVDERRG